MKSSCVHSIDCLIFSLLFHPPTHPHTHTPTHTGPNTTSIAVIAGISVLAVLVAVAIIVLVATVVGILCYGYRRPTSKVGLFLIEVNPPNKSMLACMVIEVLRVLLLFLTQVCSE